MRSLLLTLILAMASTALAQSSNCTTGATQIASGLTALTYNDATIVDGQTYDYLVTANDQFGFACSNIASNVAIPASGTHSVTLSWQASTTAGVTYAVFRAQTPTPPTTLTTVVN